MSSSPDMNPPDQPVDRRGFFRQIIRRGMEELEHLGREAGRQLGDWVSEVREGGEKNEADQPAVRPHDGAVGRERESGKSEGGSGK